MIDIEIDGKTLQVEPGSMIIQAADDAGIYIPRFCYHKKLTVAANCRMCLVEVEKVGKPLPACATPVAAGMKVFTTSTKAIDAQRAVMEFLLINHPLDCPICDQGGECELQDLSMGYGAGVSYYTEGKRSVKDKDIGPLIATDMTRCIQCTRCVRFGQEVAGVRELGATGRGEDMEIGTYIEHSITSEVSGNIIDLCPVGALTSKPFRFQARAWELNQYASIAPHDCLGSNVYIHTLRQQVMRVVPHENENINETWMSDRDRYSYLGLTNPDRLHKPMIKQGGEWHETDWQTALDVALSGIKKVIAAQGADQIGALAAPSSTLEEFYLLQKLWRGLGSSNLDHRLRQTDVSDQAQAPLFPAFNCSLSEIEKCNAILLIGINLHREQPLAALRVRKAALRGAHVSSINPFDAHCNFKLRHQSVVQPTQWVATLAALLKAIVATTDIQLPEKVAAWLTDVAVNQTLVDIAADLKASGKSVILLGALADHHPEAAKLRSLAQWIAKLTGAHYGAFTEGANSAGAWLAGAVPHRQAAGMSVTTPGLSTANMFQKPLAAYLLMGIEPDLDCANSALVEKRLAAAECVVALSSFRSPFLDRYAEVILPIASFAETSGTFVNLLGEWQSFAGVVPPAGEARPAWKVLRVMGNLLNLSGFEYTSSEEIRDELKTLVTAAEGKVVPEKTIWDDFTLSVATSAGLTRITEWPIYCIDALARHSMALQKSATSETPAIHINAATAAQFNLQQGDEAIAVQAKFECKLPVVIDERIPDACVLIPAGYAETAMLGETFGTIEIRPVT